MKFFMRLPQSGQRRADQKTPHGRQAILRKGGFCIFGLIALKLLAQS
jgi:hypothetical protein